MSMLDCTLRLAKLWNKADARAAQTAGVSLHAAVGLLDFDAVARRLEKDGNLRLRDEAVLTRRRLVRERPEYRPGKFAEHVAEEWLKFYRYLNPGSRRKELLCHGRTVDSLLGHAEQRLVAAMKLLDAKSAEKRGLEAIATSVQGLQQLSANTFEAAFQSLSPPRDGERKTTKAKQSRRRP